MKWYAKKLNKSIYEVTSDSDNIVIVIGEGSKIISEDIAMLLDNKKTIMDMLQVHNHSLYKKING